MGCIPFSHAFAMYIIIHILWCSHWEDGPNLSPLLSLGVQRCPNVVGKSKGSFSCLRKKCVSISTTTIRFLSFNLTNPPTWHCHYCTLYMRLAMTANIYVYT